MSELLPKALTAVIEELGRLPGVGARTAERYAYYLLRADKRQSTSLAKRLAELHDEVNTCPVTYALINADENISPLYSDRNRNKQLVAVVEEPLDIVALERTGQFKGTYHVLGGAISPLDGIGPEQLHIPELLKRLKADEVEELIIATNASVEGESTALFIQRQIQDAKIDVKLSRLARGIPVGVDLEYADQITLGHALEGRRTL
ncbi:MAG TPA: recombination mediator RecR [Candidatus Saccharimonas sp.]|nr:recombination mediator RecR [Patescibacteria group bacterium]MCA9335493.1 recombination protein RecR [Candidatus Saccharibacteria bacterium]HPQ82341.1 recombination mediator RecR [Candidatus Saccharimonas sp.]